MNILFFDTSQGITSICMSKNSVVQPVFYDAQPSRQAELLVVQVADYIAQHGMKWSDFAVIGCVNGIGGFTSVRIGVAAARGLAMAAGIRSVGVDLMQLMAYYYFQSSPTCALQCFIPAGNNFVAMQLFDGSHRTTKPLELLERQFFQPSQFMCVLPNIAQVGGLTQVGGVIFPLEDCAKIAVEMLLSQGIDGLVAPIPRYARPPDAKIGTPLLKPNLLKPN